LPGSLPLVTPQFLTLFRWHVLRHAGRHRLLGALNILSVALGIAVFLSIQIANDSANESFAAGVDLVAGRAHLEIRGDIDETLWPLVARQPGVQAATAVLEGIITFPDRPGEYLRLVGVDVFTSERFSTYRIGMEHQRLDLEGWLASPGAVAITSDYAARRGWMMGTSFPGVMNARTLEWRVAALIDTRDTPAAAQPRFATMDLGWMQEAMGRAGQLSAILVRLDDPARGEEAAAALRAILPGDHSVEAPRQRSFQMQTMLEAFRLNLTALSLVSLLVGTFLIYNTISASVARRRLELGILRALGASRWEIRALFLGEALIFGVIGIALGVAAGLFLGRATLGAVEQTVSSLYTLVEIERAFVQPVQILIACAFGLAAVLAGAWLPADAASRLDPVEALSRGAMVDHAQGRGAAWIKVAVGSLLLAVLCSFLALRTGPPLLAFAGAFFTLLGFAAFAPHATRHFSAGAARLPLGALWRIAADRLRRSLARNAVTVAALATAVAMTIGLTVMIFSFRQTISRWMGQSVVADLYVAPAANETVGLGTPIPADAREWWQTRPEVESVDAFAEVPTRWLDASGTPQQARLAVVDGRYRGNLDFGPLGSARAMEAVQRGEAVAISEPFARKSGLRTGGTVTIPAPGGPVSLPIAGVYRDYSRDQGMILMAQALHASHWPSTGPHSLAIYLHGGAAPDGLAEAFLARFGAGGEYAVYDNRTLRERILVIFDQTFAVTDVLRLIAVVVAVLGIALAVTTLVAERQRETGVLRAVGASAGQVRWLYMLEAGKIGAVASILGVAGGLALAVVLTWIVNPAFFGWTIHFSIPWATVLATPAWMIPVAIAAAWWPAGLAERIALAEAVREE
jgi:putative ABC transport system permease protein